ncbi:unnamed protein product [Medioppia subpectinata]|uniref:Uncharacterized protein n=1 Tax=Medioppia subpectinata TaxID=1979941 RepID=A0A7R9L3R7_9ACAR|nr:unnamed protein product [Medioppia subpectinata]CAG2114709.1 unnamed protein product [Medioppia subpectinata]
MSALKASNGYEVKALKAQLKTSNDSMEAIAEEINHLKQSNQQMVTDLSEVLALKARLKTSNDSMDTQIKDLRQKICDPEMVAPFSELLAKTSCLTEELLALNTSKGYEVKAQLKSAMDSMQTMEKAINELREMFLIFDKRDSMSDSSSSCSSIGSHNKMTTNSDNIQEMLTEIGNQNKITNNLLKALVIEKEISLTALQDVRQSAEDSEDSESIVVVDSHHE